MKRLLLIVLLCLCSAIVTYSQQQILQKKISSKYNGKPLFAVLQDLFESTNLKVFVRTEWMRCTTPVYCREDSLTVEAFLKLIFQRQPLQYEVKDGSIQISPKPLKVIVTGLYSAPLDWVSVTIPNHQPVMTNSNGEVTIDSAACEQQLRFSRVGYEPGAYELKGDTLLHVRMKLNLVTLDSVSKLINTGFQFIYKGQATGSYSQISKVQLDRQITTSILTKTEGRAAGVLLNRNRMPGTNLPFTSIRGQSTILANTEPLYVVDNLPYYGDINNLNPNDIENITVLKDAAATSIWGARAGNGVIVLTTKKGNDGKRPIIELNSSLTITAKPDLWYLPLPDSKEYMEINSILFEKKYFKGDLNTYYALVPPDVEIRQKYNSNLITEKEMEAQLNELRSKDVRNDQRRLLYQTGLTTRHTLSVAGGGENLRYYLGGGFENEDLNQVKSYRQRTTLTGNLSYGKSFYELGIQAFFTDTRSTVHATPDGFYPYSDLTNEVPRDLKQHYKDSISGLVQDWAYRPLQENQETAISQKGRHSRLTLTGKFHLTGTINIQFIYERQQGSDEMNDIKGAASYYARNLQNTFARNNGGVADYLIPLGGILDYGTNEYTANKARVQMNYEWNKKRNFRISALAGVEYGKFRTDSFAMRYYGYFGDRNRAVPSSKFEESYPLFYDKSSTGHVPNVNRMGSGFDFYPSAYANTAITAWRRYTFSLSGRIDQSNLFGANTNNQSIPLWSSGFKWNVGDEFFYPKTLFFSYCTIRASYGYSGNVDKRTTAYTSAAIVPATNRFNAVQLSILSPDNPFLRWERSGLLNVGIELADRKKQLELSVEYYRRKSKFLLASGAQDPTLGSSFFWGNNAAMKGSGFDVSLATNHALGRQWRLNTLLLVSNTTNKVTRYDDAYKQAWFYTDPGFLSPKVGASVYSLYAYKWGKLDAAGDPQGYVEGNLSKNYDSIYTASPNSLERVGSSVPTWYGSFYAALSYGRFTFSATLDFKARYYFRRSSINYNQPLSRVAAGLDDYASRWQYPGDENTTDVPALNPDPSRNLFYSNAMPLVTRGDQVRLYDASVSYTMPPAKLKKIKLQALSFYCIGNNLGLIWKAAPGKIDPDFLTGYPTPKSITIGVKCTY